MKYGGDIFMAEGSEVEIVGVIIFTVKLILVNLIHICKIKNNCEVTSCYMLSCA